MIRSGSDILKVDFAVIFFCSAINGITVSANSLTACINSGSFGFFQNLSHKIIYFNDIDYYN
jgi:hypothetical protein